ncbi:hypothetical protein HDU88_001579, partial [Geranomyces variabilis]
MEIVGGLGILVTPIPGGYEISSESLKTKRKDNEDEEKTDDDDTEQTLDASNSTPE